GPPRHPRQRWPHLAADAKEDQVALQSCHRLDGEVRRLAQQLLQLLDVRDAVERVSLSFGGHHVRALMASRRILRQTFMSGEGFCGLASYSMLMCPLNFTSRRALRTDGTSRAPLP